MKDGSWVVNALIRWACWRISRAIESRLSLTNINAIITRESTVRPTDMNVRIALNLANFHL